MKKLLALCLSVLMCASFAACGDNAGDSSKDDAAKAITLTVWGPANEQDLLKKLCEDYAKTDPDTTYNFEFGVCSEADAKTKVLEDAAAAADIFTFAADHTRDLVNAKALYKITKNKDAIIADNNATAVGYATIGGDLYAYPKTADNGYFLYYDKSVLSDEDVKSFETMLEVAGTAGKKIFMDVSNGFYNVAFFAGAGCEMKYDGTSITLDYNNATGLKVAESMKAITANSAFLTGDDTVLTGGIGTDIAAAVGGVWNANAIQEALGDNYAATKLPTFKVDGVDTQMSGFLGCKLVGINSAIKPEKAVKAMALAEYLTNEKSQLETFNALGFGPSNLKAAQDEAVVANVALNALNMQAEFTIPQDVPGTFWSPMEAFGTTLENKDYSKDLQTLLDEMVAGIVG